MKRIIYAIIALSVLLCAGSCSGDTPLSEGSEPDGTLSSNQVSIINALQVSKWYVEDGGDFSFGSDYIDYDERQFTLFFISGEEGVSRLHYRHYSTDADNSAGVKAMPFVYEVRVDGEIDITFEDGEKDKLRLDGKKMLKSETYNTEYEPRTITSDDRTWIQKNRKPKGVCGTDMTWVFNRAQNTLYISGTGKMTDYNSGQQPWSSLGNEVQHLVIEGNVERIGNHAFSCCPLLQDCEYWSPSGGCIKQIGKEAFAGTSLSVISLPSSVESVEEGAFAGCKKVSKVYMTDLDDKLEIIGDDAFNFTYISDYLTLPPNVKRIGQRAFMGWTIREKLTLNDNLEHVGHYAFTKVGGKIVIPNSVKSIGSFAFCGGFNEVVIGSGVESIAENAFDGTTRYSSTNIVSVNLGNPLKLSGSIMANYNSCLWNLRVPKGSKVSYSKANYWKDFRSITEDATLVSGNGTPEDGGDSDGGDGSGDRKPAMDYRNVTYSIAGDTRTFKMIRVEGGGLHPFYIMQTEIPIHSQIKFGSRETILPLDRNGDGFVIKYEFRRFIDDIRAETGLDFRFPTLAEWQYAAKGGNKSKGYKYSGSNSIDEVAWYKDNSNGYVHDVALKQPNELGLYDMSGNYAEVASDFDDIYIIDAYDCGGSWKHAATNCQPSSYELDSYANTRIPGSTYRNKNVIDSRYISVRLVFAEP